MFNRREHPRPQFIREDFLSLDGQWDFAFDDQNEGLKNKWFHQFPESRKIEVPFTYETQLSGIDEQEQHSVVWYEKTFIVDDLDNRVLTFEGSDYYTKVWLNGELLGDHRGAYERFSFDLADYLVEGENRITVRIVDSLMNEQPRGKQTWKEETFGCWYVGTTGIWKSVWLEKAAFNGLRAVKMTPDFDNDCIILEPSVKNKALLPTDKNYFFEATVTFKGELVSYHRSLFVHEMSPIQMETRIKKDSNWGTQRWSPHEPNLYDVTFKLFDESNNEIDSVVSYFGMRKISIENGKVLLNNEQLYQRLILDQGYWPESGLTPPSIDALEKDLDLTIESGYNGLRKHQKIEDERFMYLCDTKGLLVWVEMPSTYIFNDLAMTNLADEWRQIVEQHYNHPSVITWVPFNESWGVKGIVDLVKPQQFTESIYYLTKAIDANRPVITNDGWEHTISDILTLHDYEEFGAAFAERYADKEAIVENDVMFNRDWFAFAKGYGYKGQPIIISEYGGIAFENSTEENWGYGNQVKNEADFLERFNRITHAIQDLEYINGFCYTQLTDVEQEINGLYTPDRQPKVTIAEIKATNERRFK